MPRTDRASTVVVVVVLAVTVVGAGCVSFSGSDPLESEFTDDVESAEPPETMSATLEVEIELEGERETISEPVWIADDGTSRIGDLDDGSDFLRVDDGDSVWYYDGETETATSRDSNATAHTYFSFVYDEQDRYAEEYELTDVEETTSDGDDAFRADFDPPSNETIDRSIGVSVGNTEYILPFETSDVDGTHADSVELVTDDEYHFPLEYHVQDDDRSLEVSITYTDVTFDEELADDRFTFEPSNATAV
ncbi:Outer membrane lipoprotein-sorting protein [Natronorubrum sediminis]|uniref:Outer membrane lipoprotein-sorting protein n=1 Tax=Natronorubrum sediminis TaxID=640943 RepID=A0A1H6FMM5_9EURY|nr:outer-membrane lipoprotein carrier protein LolA [Natronorubrum sediminis]SEH12157.1 Outer membrane lipoprotein-sorting protein [Natronorubrum sediminis]